MAKKGKKVYEYRLSNQTRFGGWKGAVVATSAAQAKKMVLHRIGAGMHVARPARSKKRS